MAQPSSVTNAVRLMWLGAVLSIVSLVLVVAQTDAIKEFGTLGVIGGAIAGQTALNTAINVITLIIAVLAIVFMWQGSSKAWYTRRS